MMKLTVTRFILVLTFSQVAFEQLISAKFCFQSVQTKKQRVLDSMGELYPLISGTVGKPNVKKPGYEVEKRVDDEILAIANESAEDRELVVHTLVEALEDPKHHDGFFYSALWSGASYVLGQLKAVEAIDILSQHLDIQHGPFTLSYSGFPAVQGLIQIGEPAIPKLAEVLLANPKTTCRGFAAFALGAIGGEQARDALERAHGTERDPDVMKEIELQLTVVQRPRPR